MATRSIPENAICVSLDEDNNYLYVGTAQHENHVVPGKIIPAKGVCYIAYAGGEHEKTEYEYLCAKEYKWQMFNECDNISNVGAKCGIDRSDGEEYYVGRVLYKGIYIPGSVKLSHNCCYIPYGGEEIQFEDYEVLIIED